MKSSEKHLLRNIYIDTIIFIYNLCKWRYYQKTCQIEGLNNTYKIYFAIRNIYITTSYQKLYFIRYFHACKKKILLRT